MKRKLAYSSTLILLSFLMITSCNNGNGSANSKKISIGIVLPFTGELASYSEPLKQGMELAVEKIESKKGEKVDLKYVDSKAEAKTAVSAVMQMTSVNAIHYFIGDVSSTTTLAMIPVIESSKSVLLSPGASSSKLNNISKNFARNYPSSLDEAIKSAEYAFNTLKVSKASVVYVNNEFGVEAKETFENRYKQLGGIILSSEPYNFGSVDFKTIILKIKAAKPDVLYLAGNQKEMGNFMRQLRTGDYSGKVISNISFLEPDCLNIAKEAAEGVLVPVAYYNPNDTSSKTAADFVASYKKKYNTEPSAAVAVGFDAAMLYYDAIQKVGDSPMKVAEYLRNLKNYEGAIGTFSIENGDINMKTVFKVIKNGKPVDTE